MTTPPARTCPASDVTPTVTDTRRARRRRISRSATGIRNNTRPLAGATRASRRGRCSPKPGSVLLYAGPRHTITKALCRLCPMCARVVANSPTTAGRVSYARSVTPLDISPGEAKQLLCVPIPRVDAQSLLAICNGQLVLATVNIRLRPGRVRR